MNKQSRYVILILAVCIAAALFFPLLHMKRAMDNVTAPIASKHSNVLISQAQAIQKEAIESIASFISKGLYSSAATGRAIGMSKKEGSRNAHQGTSQSVPIALKPDLIAQGLLSIKNPTTGLVASHFGHPGYENLGFLYDIAVSALALDAAGHKEEAEAILDYFAKRLSIPMEEVLSLADTNGVYGIIKLLDYEGPHKKKTKALVNAIDISSSDVRGRGLLEFYTTPGPMAFLIFSMLQVNADKYKAYAADIGETLLTMQDEDGGVRDGDRAPDRIHTEPNMDSAAAFLMLHKVTGEQKWHDAAAQAMAWFAKHAYNKEAGTIYQGVWLGRPSRIFATDVYSWTMAGPEGDALSSDELKRLTETMLSGCLVKITLDLPDGSRPTSILADFSNPNNSRVVNARLGSHPMGTIEWTGGVVLALQKNAVRFWERGDKAAAIRYKALADLLLAETARCFYSLGDDIKGLATFYATAQGVEIAPFGAIENKSTNGWRTTFFYVDRGAGLPSLKGGASIGAWVLLPYLGVNPFIYKDDYKSVYDAIPLDKAAVAAAASELEEYVGDRIYAETVPVASPDKRVQIVEPRMFNRRMFEAIERGFQSKEAKSIPAARSSFAEAVTWASKVLQNPVWLGLARADNDLKKKECGGIVFYPWEYEFLNNDHLIHFEIQRYPMLNEVGTAAWGMATASFELGKIDETKKWIGKIIDDYSLHQIASVRQNNTDIIIGYWNALVSWESKSLGANGNWGMYELYRSVLLERNMASAQPQIVISPGGEKFFRSDMSGPADKESQPLPDELPVPAPEPKK